METPVVISLRNAEIRVSQEGKCDPRVYGYSPCTSIRGRFAVKEFIDGKPRTKLHNSSYDPWVGDERQESYDVEYDVLVFSIPRGNVRWEFEPTHRHGVHPRTTTGAFCARCGSNRTDEEGPLEVIVRFLADDITRLVSPTATDEERKLLAEEVVVTSPLPPE